MKRISRRWLATTKTELGYSMSTRRGRRGVASLLERFGDRIFDNGRR